MSVTSNQLTCTKKTPQDPAHAEKTHMFDPTLVVVVVVVCVWGRGGGGRREGWWWWWWWWWWWCGRDASRMSVSVDKRQRLHLILVTERLRVRLPSPWEPSTTKNSWQSRARKMSTHVQADGVRKRQQNAAKPTTFQLVMTLFMREF